MQRFLVGVLCLVVGLVATSSDLGGQTRSDADAPIDPSSTVIPGRYIVVFRDDVSDPAGTADRLALQHGGLIKHRYEHAIKGFAATLSDAAVEALRQNPAVAYVEPDRTAQVFATQTNPPNWGLDRIDQPDLPLNNAYTYANDASSVNLYIVDSGVRSTHVDFEGRVLLVPNGTNGDFVGDGHGSAVDCFGHGTHVAGIAAGQTYGVAKGVTIWAARVLDCSGNGSASTLISAVDWITANGNFPAIVNLSLGFFETQSVTDAVENSIAAGFTYVVAAGNQIVPADACTISPANAPHAITVGATGNNDTEAFFSNYGTCVDILAPGQSILSTWHTTNTATQTRSGTSSAAPHVAGAAALYLCENPGATPAEIKAALIGGATPNTITLHASSQGGGTPNLFLNMSFIGACGGPPVNTPPFVASAIADVNVPRNSPPLNNYRDLNNVFSDAEDGGDLSFAVIMNSDTSLVAVTIDPSDSTLDLTFAPDVVGTATVVIRATDWETAAVHDTFLVSLVDGNTPPMVAAPISDWTVMEDDPPVSNYRDLNQVFGDLESGSALAFAIVSNTYPSLVSATVDAVDSTLDLSFGQNKSGLASITVRATDAGALWVEDTFVITVNPVNDEPYVVTEITDTTVAEDNPVINNYRDLNQVFMDVEDGTALILFWANTNPGLVSVSVGADSAVDLTFSPNKSGTAVIIFRAFDSEFVWAEEAFSVTVTAVNDAPTVTAPIPDIAVPENNPPIPNYRDLNQVFYDVENGRVLAFSINSNSNPSLVSATIDPSDSTLDLAFAAGNNGVATIVVRAADAGALFVQDTFVATVHPANYTPVVVAPIPDTTVPEDNPPVPNYRDLNQVFNDVENGGALAFTITSNTNPTVVIATIDASDSTLDLTFGPNQSGVASIVVRATDAGGLFVQDTFVATVNAVNDQPVVVAAIPDTAVAFGSPPLPNYRDLNNVFNDVENGSALTFTIQSNNAPQRVMSTIDASDSTLDLSFGQLGAATIVVRARDAGSLFIQDTFTVTVQNPQNMPPLVVSAIPDTTAFRGSAPIDNYRDLNDVFHDPQDGDALTFTIQSNTAPSRVSVTIDADSALDLVVSPTQTGTATITIAARDSHNNITTDVFVVTVIANSPPAVVSAIPDTTVAWNTVTFSYRDLNAVFLDPHEGSRLSFTVQSNSHPSVLGATIDPADSTLDLTCAPDQGGVVTIVVRAMDSGLLWVDESFVVTVQGVVTGVPDGRSPAQFALHQNVPNPFNPTTVIHFETTQTASVVLRIYDGSGRLVRTLLDGELPASKHEVMWDGRDERGNAVATGVYFYRLVAGDYRATKRMVLLK